MKEIAVLALIEKFKNARHEYYGDKIYSDVKHGRNLGYLNDYAGRIN